VDAVVEVMPDFPDIAAAYLYGSALGDEPVGDVDIGIIQVVGSEVMGASRFGRLERLLHERASTVLPPWTSGA
jgi:hypothetical protein